MSAEKKTLPDGILPPVVTTFRKDAFDAKSFRANLEYLNGTEVAGYVVLGSNGESELLSDDEVIDVVQAAAEARNEDKTLIVGTGRQSTRTTIKLTERAASAGAQAVLVAPPTYYRSAMTESALEFHYRAVADASEVPVLLYHVPKFAPVTFSPALVTTLSRHPNILGIKDTSGDMTFLGSVLRDRPENFHVYVGSASFLLCGLALGADGGILALANIAPRECVSLLNEVRSGDWESARKLQLRLLAVNDAVTSRFGVAGLKQALDLLGLKGGEPRRPLEPLSRSQEDELRLVLERTGLLPVPTA